MNEFTETSGINNPETPSMNTPTPAPETTYVSQNPTTELSQEEKDRIAKAYLQERYPFLFKENGESAELIDVMGGIKSKLEELEQGINSLKEGSTQTEIPDEDPKDVVRRMSGINEEVAPEQGPLSVDQIFDNYKQALNQNPTAELPKELSARTEFGPNPKVLDLSQIPTNSEQTDPLVERDPQTQEKQVVFPFVSSTGELRRITFDYEPFAKAFQEAIQPPNEGVYIKVIEEGKKAQIVKLGGYHFNKLINAISAVEQQQDTVNQAPQETPPVQENVTPESNQFDHQTPPPSQGFGL